jgi:hypothetical protein
VGVGSMFFTVTSTAMARSIRLSHDQHMLTSARCCIVSLDPSDFVGRSGHPSDDDIKGVK